MRCSLKSQINQLRNGLQLTIRDNQRFFISRLVINHFRRFVFRGRVDSLIYRSVPLVDRRYFYGTLVKGSREKKRIESNQINDYFYVSYFGPFDLILMPFVSSILYSAVSNDVYKSKCRINTMIHENTYIYVGFL